MTSNRNYEDLPIMNIGGFFVGIAGSSSRIPSEKWRDLARKIGEEIMRRGHRMVSGGCSGGITQFCADAASSWLKKNNKEEEIKYRIISIVPEEEGYAYIRDGQFLICKELNRKKRRPFMASIMDVLITVAGSEPMDNELRGTKAEGRACFNVGTPVIPIRLTGGASLDLWSDINKKYSKHPLYKDIIRTPPWKKLDNPSIDQTNLAIAAVDLAERMAWLKLATDRSISPSTFSNRVFVIMPFNNDLDPVWKIIKRVFKSPIYNIPINLECNRANGTLIGLIDESILNQIHVAPFVIADLTGYNPNVLYELGYALGIGKRAILINQSPDKKIIDLANQNQIGYELNNLKILEEKLVEAINQLLGLREKE